MSGDANAENQYSNTDAIRQQHRIDKAAQRKNRQNALQPKDSVIEDAYIIESPRQRTQDPDIYISPDDAAVLCSPNILSPANAAVSFYPNGISPAEAGVTFSPNILGREPSVEERLPESNYNLAGRYSLYDANVNHPRISTDNHTNINEKGKSLRVIKRVVQVLGIVAVLALIVIVIYFLVDHFGNKGKVE